MKRKLIKVTHRDGSISYTIKVRVFPFIWVVESECMGHYVLVFRNMDFEHAKMVLKRLNDRDVKRKGHKIKCTEVVKIGEN
jgi:hypothetical protein